MGNMKIDSLYVVEVGRCLLLSLVPKDSHILGAALFKVIVMISTGAATFRRLGKQWRSGL
jgi:hypothetical protein